MLNGALGVTLHRITLRYCATVLLFLATTAFTYAQASPPPPEDVVLFTNGDQLSGTLLRQVGDSVVFRSDMAGEITIPLAKIKDLHTAGKFAVLRRGVPVAESRRVQPERIQIANSHLLLLDHADPPPAIPLASVAYVVDAQTFTKDLAHTPGFFSGWIGTATLGATVVQATQHGGTLTADVALTRQIPPLTYFRPRNRTLVNLQETYGTSTTPVIPQTNPPSPDAVVKTSIFHADAERDQYLSKRTYLLAATAFDHNFAQGLDLQQLYGGGFGFTPFSNPKQQLDLKADLHYLKQGFFDAATNQNLVGSTFAETYRRTLPAKIQLTENFNVIPAWNDPNAYSANGSVALTLPVFKRFSFTNAATDAFLNNPSPGYRKNSFTYTAGITYTLH